MYFWYLSAVLAHFKIAGLFWIDFLKGRKLIFENSEILAYKWINEWFLSNFST